MVRKRDPHASREAQYKSWDSFVHCSCVKLSQSSMLDLDVCLVCQHSFGSDTESATLPYTSISAICSPMSENAYSIMLRMCRMLCATNQVRYAQLEHVSESLICDVAL